MSGRINIAILALSVLWPAMGLASGGSRDALLFLDVNNSPHEIRAAREAARKSGREFVLFPPDDGVSRQAFDRARQELRRVNNAQNRNRCFSEIRPFQCVALDEQSNRLSNQLESARENLKFDKENLKTFISQQVAANRVFSTVVVSGHDGTGGFSGEFGKIEDAELANILDDHPSLKEGLRALHLWGCYTTSPGSLMLNWKKHFPNVLAISGFDLKAPLNNVPSGWTYLAGIIEREPRLFQTRDANALRRLLREIPGVTNMHAAISACGFFANNSEAYAIEEMVQRCQGWKQVLEEREPRIRCFERGEAACVNLPEPPGRGEIREFYNFLQSASACNNFLPEETIFLRFDRDKILRLIFGRVVQQNFAQQFATELRESNDFLRVLGADASLRLDNLASLSRRDLIRTIEELGNFVNEGFRSYGTDPREIRADMNLGRLSALRELHRNLLKTLVNFESSCVPMTWLEPNSRDQGNCVRRDEIGQRGLLEFTTRMTSNSEFEGLSAVRKYLEDAIDRVNESNSNESESVRNARSAYLQAQFRRVSAHLLESMSGRRRLGRERTRQLDLAVERAQRRLNHALHPPIPLESLPLQETTDWELVQANAGAALEELRSNLAERRATLENDELSSAQREQRLRWQRQTEERIRLEEARLKLANAMTDTEAHSAEAATEARKELRDLLVHQARETAQGQLRVLNESSEVAGPRAQQAIRELQELITKLESPDFQDSLVEDAIRSRDK